MIQFDCHETVIDLRDQNDLWLYLDASFFLIHRDKTVTINIFMNLFH